MLKYQQNPTAAIAKSTDTGAKQTITDAKHSHASKNARWRAKRYQEKSYPNSRNTSNR